MLRNSKETMAKITSLLGLNWKILLSKVRNTQKLRSALSQRKIEQNQRVINFIKFKEKLVATPIYNPSVLAYHSLCSSGQHTELQKQCRPKEENGLQHPSLQQCVATAFLYKNKYVLASKFKLLMYLITMPFT